MERTRTLGILTSGGDSPGMNAALRAVAKVAAANNLRVLGIQDGFNGLLEGRTHSFDFITLDDAARRGGTLLGTARSKQFPTPEGQALARKQILEMELDALLVIGGNGSLAGALALTDAKTHTGALLQIAGLPASIDNDLACTAMSIGVDTAQNTILDASDRILDTASSHHRIFLIEVMGRDCGYLALTSAVAAGADAVLVPETNQTEAEILETIYTAVDRAYSGDGAPKRVLILKSEGVKMPTLRIKECLDERLSTRTPSIDTRVTVLGHIVRGGTPSSFDRLLAARLAHAAVRALADGRSGFMAGSFGPGSVEAPCSYDPAVVLTPLEKVLSETDAMSKGTTAIALWRKRMYKEILPMLQKRA